MEVSFPCTYVSTPIPDTDACAPPAGLSSIDLTILVPSQMSVRASHEIESKVREAIMSERRDAREVKIHIHGVDSAELEDWKRDGVNGESDFGRGGCRD